MWCHFSGSRWITWHKRTKGGEGVCFFVSYASNTVLCRCIRVCPCVPPCSNEHRISLRFICPFPGRNWTSGVKGEPLRLSRMSRCLAHLSLCSVSHALEIMGSGFLPIPSPRCILNLSDVICLLMCSEYPLQLLNGSRYISLSSHCNQVANLDHISGCLPSFSRSSPLCHSPLFFSSPLLLLRLLSPRLGLAPLAIVLDSSPADPASSALHFCTLISLSAFALRDKSLHTHTRQVHGVSTGCGFNDKQLNESALLAWQQALQ